MRRVIRHSLIASDLFWPTHLAVMCFSNDTCARGDKPVSSFGLRARIVLSEEESNVSCNGTWQPVSIRGQAKLSDDVYDPWVLIMRGQILSEICQGCWSRLRCISMFCSHKFRKSRLPPRCKSRLLYVKVETEVRRETQPQECFVSVSGTADSLSRPWPSTGSRLISGSEAGDFARSLFQ